MTSKHTPGPWENNYSDITTGNGSVHIASVSMVHDFPCNDDMEDRSVIAQIEAECEANARLIARAPELLEALWKLANEASGFLALSDIERHGMTNSRILRDRIEEARNIIAKAGAQ